MAGQPSGAVKRALLLAARPERGDESGHVPPAMIAEVGDTSLAKRQVAPAIHSPMITLDNTQHVRPAFQGIANAGDR